MPAERKGAVAQICEAFLHAGLMKYEKEGTKYVQKVLARQEQEPLILLPTVTLAQSRFSQLGTIVCGHLLPLK